MTLVDEYNGTNLIVPTNDTPVNPDHGSYFDGNEILSNCEPASEEFDRVNQAIGIINAYLLNVKKIEAENFIENKLLKHLSIQNKSRNAKIITDHFKTEYEHKQKTNKNKTKKPEHQTVQPVQKQQTNFIINDKLTDWDKYCYPSSYTVKDGRVVREYVHFDIITKEEETLQAAVSYTPFILSGRSEHKNEEDKKYFVVRYETGTKQCEFFVEMSDLLGPETMQRKLTSKGINIPAEQRNECNKYIGAFIHELGDNLKTHEVISKNGWNEDYTLFVMGKRGITKDKIIHVNNMEEHPKLTKPFHTSGTIENWVLCVKPVLDYDIARFMFYVGMSAPLYKILKTEIALMVLYGPTSRGKSSLAAMISSALGNPFGTNGLEFPVGKSDVPLVNHVAGMSDMPVDIEEATGEKQRKALLDSVYYIRNGVERATGKQNGGNNENARDFKTQAIITCEDSIVEEIKHAGGKHGTKSIGGKHELLPDNVKDIVDKMKRDISENYGHFYPILIQKIMNDIPHVKKLYEYALTKINPDLSNVPEESRATTGRSISTFATYLAAGYLCEEIFNNIGIKSKSPDEVEAMINKYFDKCVLEMPVEPDYIRALRHLSETISNERSKFYHPDNTAALPSDPHPIGNIRKDKIEIVEKEYTRILKEGQFIPKTLTDYLEAENIGKKTSIRVGGLPNSGLQIITKEMYRVLGLKDNSDFVDSDPLFKTILEAIKLLVKVKDFAPKHDMKVIFGSRVTDYTDKLLEKGIIEKSVRGETEGHIIP